MTQYIGLHWYTALESLLLPPWCSWHMLCWVLSFSIIPYYLIKSHHITGRPNEFSFPTKFWNVKKEWNGAHLTLFDWDVSRDPPLSLKSLMESWGFEGRRRASLQWDFELTRFRGAPEHLRSNFVSKIVKYRWFSAPWPKWAIPPQLLSRIRDKSYRNVFGGWSP